MKELIVGLGERAYPIYIEHGCLLKIGKDLAQRKLGNKYCVIADKNVADLYADVVMQSLAENNITAELITFPAGEAQKNLSTFAALNSSLAQKKFDRKDAIIAFGGGVTGDLAGFVAASYMRGIPFIQIPTTLLSQVDSSVGGKTGVDIPEGKNLVGAFYQPKVVFIDPMVLNSLDKDEILGGIAEVIKYGVIRDSGFFGYLQSKRQELLELHPATVNEVIYTCCKIKADVVAEDEKESNVRRILNYGHTIGHAVEAVSNFSMIHGKAVAIGMIAAARIAVRKGLLSGDDYREIFQLIEGYGLPVEVPQDYDKDRIKGYILSDKKVVSGSVAYVLPTKIGEVDIRSDVEEADVDHALSGLR